MAIGKISSIKKQFAPDVTNLGSVLAEKGFSRSPGTKMGVSPYRETTGEYRSGLDPNAKYINFMAAEDKITERAKINGWREFIQMSLGEEFFHREGRSAFYTDMYHPDKMGTEQVCQKAYLSEGDNTFDLERVFELIQFAYLRVHPVFVARSYQDYQRGVASDTVRFYVNDEDIETKLLYQDNLALDKAVTAMGTYSCSEKIKIARLMGVNVSHDSTEEQVYNVLSNFLKTTTHSSGDRLFNVKLFNRISSLDPTTIQIRYLIDLGFSYNIYRTQKGRVFDGQNEVAETKEALAELLAKPKYQKELTALEERIKAVRQAEV
jgi:hypothetical protein